MTKIVIEKRHQNDNIKNNIDYTIIFTFLQRERDFESQKKVPKGFSGTFNSFSNILYSLSTQ
jgi:hypothetical protein